MSDNRLALCQQGSFAGEFVITNEQCSFSIGDYIEVFLKEQPYWTGDTILNRPIFALPLTVVECCHDAKITVILRRVSGVGLHHWMRCLNVGIISVVVPFKYQHRDRIWYMPKIDGWVPGLFGRVRAPSPKSR